MSNPGLELPPPAQLMNLLAGGFVAQSIHVATRLGLADRLAEGASTAQALASAVGAHAPSLYRLMRGLAMVGVLEEQDGGSFTLTPIGQCLRRSAPGSLASMALLWGADWHLRPWAALEHAVRTGQSAFPHVFGGKDVFAWFAEGNREAFDTFNDAMTEFSAMACAAVTAAYDFSACKRITDIGGGHGLMLSSILKAAPQATGVLFDMPSVVEGAKKPIADAGLAGRCEIVGGDFFAGVPTGCDTYVIKHIIHDWDEASCVKILGHCRQGLVAGGRVLLIEMVLPPPGTPHFGKLLDLEMLVMTPGGQERTEREYAALFAKAALRLSRIVPTHSPVSVIEAVAS